MKKILNLLSIFIIINLSISSFYCINLKAENIILEKIKPTNYNVEYWAVCYDHFGGWNSNLLKDVLLENGWNEDHIRIVSSKSNKQEIIENMSYISERDDENDVTLIVIHSHGGRGIFKLGSESMYYEDLNKEVNKLDSSKIAIIVHTCFSGSSIEYLKGDGRVIITSASNETCSGVNEMHVEIGLAGLADELSDNNGIVTAEELYNYYNFITTDSQPLINDNCPGDLNLVFLSSENKNMDQIQLQSYVYNNLYENDDYYAQSFIPQYSIISKAKLFITSRDGCKLKLSLRQELEGNDLSTFTSDFLIGRKLVDCDFPDISVTPGETYYLIVKGIQGTASLQGAHDPDLYANGESLMYMKNTGKWSENDDIFFITYGMGNFENDAPNTPTISGPIIGKKDNKISFKICCSDPNANYISYYVEWGDGKVEEWIGPFNSGFDINLENIWNEKGNKNIKIKAKDNHNSESGWGEFSIQLSKNKLVFLNLFLQRFLKNFLLNINGIKNIILI